MPAAPPSRPRTRLAAAVAAALALVLVAGCSGEDDVQRAEFEEKLIERTGISEDEAVCITDRVYEEYGDDQGQINTIVRAATEDELTEPVQATLRAINEECVTSPVE